MQHLINQSNAQYLIYQNNSQFGHIFVYENDDYFWLKFSDVSIQGIIKKTQPEIAYSPIIKSLLLFLLQQTQQLKVLNLGLGCANIDRTLRYLHNNKLISLNAITTVELNPTIIALAQQYFNLPNETKVVNQCAQSYLATNTSQFDIIIIDIFSDQQHLDFIETAQFWQQLKFSAKINTIISANLSFDSPLKLQNLLCTIKQNFPYIKLIEFTQYKNIVLLASQSPLTHVNINNVRENKKLNLITHELPQAIKTIHAIEP
ncbi:hypothetical protein J8L70_04450 [Pseudoalteromonas sp. MMG010]|uniref:hypothetical protein n=1 Tax=Pseudoalteromonas sp. MMG010 TaxID=2822685 RepID=UPI001B3A65B3|nr:hypothetical protein [Pseudoalteromonas sp. MMG010]MBQ4832485.1 hypothetical protein [Pseudoalteromonas sp. MMG010]